MKMQWQNLLTMKRYGHTKPPQIEIGRSHFHKDQDRIIFSSAFRRLGRKTQVHPLALNDHIHTRLTHSIEVGSLGRSLGIRIGELIQEQLPDWCTAYDIGMIVQSACLAHDIGNPPFGHAGEYAIRDWFQHQADKHLLSSLSKQEYLDLITFEGNAQGFRVVTKIENHLFNGGLRLTLPTLGALLKYPWDASNSNIQGKFSVYQTEINILNSLANTLGLIKQGENRWCRHPLAYLVEVADDICYAILDLEDAMELNILSFDEVKSILLTLCGDNYTPDEQLPDTQISNRRKVSALRGKAMESMLNSAVEAYKNNQDAIMTGQYQGELLNDGYLQVKEGLHQAKTLARERVFPNTRKTELEVGAFTTLSILLEAFCHAVYENHHSQGQQLSYRSERIISLMGIHAPAPSDALYQAYMRALDFISGMTDNYAAHLAKQIGGLP